MATVNSCCIFICTERYSLILYININSDDDFKVKLNYHCLTCVTWFNTSFLRLCSWLSFLELVLTVLYCMLGTLNPLDWNYDTISSRPCLIVMHGALLYIHSYFVEIVFQVCGFIKWWCLSSFCLLPFRCGDQRLWVVLSTKHGRLEDFSWNWGDNLF